MTSPTPYLLRYFIFSLVLSLKITGCKTDKKEETAKTDFQRPNIVYIGIHARKMFKTFIGKKQQETKVPGRCLLSLL
ncbi:hypothetical protein LPB144_07455 [Christiangramia salexigens]|uniref:Uncharacterized protein n=1 Tax=Christiangramia salexigens TaxID=1913577 RepID=A0A1L3J580_9FLAO|nr:hypothetical protein LPB144_07455 [Christiangramia salexigens]